MRTPTCTFFTTSTTLVTAQSRTHMAARTWTLPMPRTIRPGLPSNGRSRSRSGELAEWRRRANRAGSPRGHAASPADVLLRDERHLARLENAAGGHDHAAIADDRLLDLPHRLVEDGHLALRRRRFRFHELQVHKL